MTHANPNIKNSASPPTLQVDWIDLRALSDQEHLSLRFCLLVTASHPGQFLYLEHFPDCTAENMYVGLAHALEAWAKAPEQAAGLLIMNMPYSSLALLGSLGWACLAHKEV
jgi:hypothetical protein